LLCYLFVDMLQHLIFQVLSSFLQSFDLFEVIVLHLGHFSAQGLHFELMGFVHLFDSSNAPASHLLYPYFPLPDHLLPGSQLDIDSFLSLLASPQKREDFLLSHLKGLVWVGNGLLSCTICRICWSSIAWIWISRWRQSLSMFYIRLLHYRSVAISDRSRSRRYPCAYSNKGRLYSYA